MRLTLLLFFAAVVVFLPVSMHRAPWVMADETMYARGAWNLLHRGLLLPDIPGAMNYPPVYPLLLSAGSLFVDQGSAHLAYQTINILLWLIGAILTYYMARSFRSRIPPLLVSAIYLATPSLLAYIPLVMSENLTALLMLLTGYALYRWTISNSQSWLILGWAVALTAPFCRVTAVVVPIAFALGLGAGSAHGGKHPNRWAQRTVLGMALLAIILLVTLPTSILKIYHPWSTFVVAIRTMVTARGWATLAGNSMTNLALLLTGSAGMVWVLVSRVPADQRPIQRYLQALLLGLFLMTIGYMQYGSAGPHSSVYLAVLRYMDPGIVAALPWLFLLDIRPRRSFHILLVVVGALIAMFFWPTSGFKPGQTLSTAGLGLGMAPFSSIAACIPHRIAVFLVCALPALAMAARGKFRILSPVLCLLLFIPLSHDALAHDLAMSRARERTESRLWELGSVVPADAKIVVERGDLDDELTNVLYSGLFWLPINEVQLVKSAAVQTVSGNPVVQLTKRWLPDRILHGGSHKWYLRGQSPPPIKESRFFYDFGQGDNSYLFQAPPADFGAGRWSGESPIVELHLQPQEYTLYIAQKPSPKYGECVGRVSMNKMQLGQITTADSVSAFTIPARLLRPDGRQLLSMRISPRTNPEGDGPWLFGIRLDWIYCVPKEWDS